jgi:hypothetical protein
MVDGLLVLLSVRSCAACMIIQLSDSVFGERQRPKVRFHVIKMQK